MKTSCLPISF